MRRTIALQHTEGAIDGLVGLVAEGASAAGLKQFDGIKAFLEHVNKAFADAGQSVASVSVSPTGIVVTTGPAVP